jgi:flagellar hook-associated protein 2
MSTTSSVMTNPITNDVIDQLVTAYTTQQTTNLVTPLQTKLTGYQNINTAYTTMSSMLSTLNTDVQNLQGSGTGSSSGFTSMIGTSSNSNFVGITAGATATASNYQIRVNQIAKSDIVQSNTLSSTGINTDITGPGAQNFTIVTGDGNGGQNTSNISVNFTASDFTNGTITNQAVMDKIQTAINSDQAVVQSNDVTGSTASSGTFNLTLGGTVHAINYSAGNYSDVMDSIVSQVNKITGLSAEKDSDGNGGYTLKITVTDPTKNISIGGDTGTLVNELNIAATNEIGASGVVSASSFSPSPGNYQFSLTSKQTGNDNRIISLTDANGSSALSTMGINLGTSRPTFAQSTDGTTSTAGFVYATSDLNSEFQFNGLNLVRDSNTVTDLVKGVSFQLNSVMQSTDSTVTTSVSTDTSTIQSSINTFISDFNNLYTYLKQNTSISVTPSSTSTDSTGATTTTPAAITRGALCDDPNTQALLNLMTSLVSLPVSGIDPKQINSLSDMGITFDVTNGLSVTNQTQLTNAITNNSSQLNTLFNSTNGIATVLNSRVTPYLGVGGYLANSQTTINKSITTIQDNITSEQAIVTKDADNTRSQYEQMQQQYDNIIYMQTFISQNSTFFSG